MYPDGSPNTRRSGMTCARSNIGEENVQFVDCT